MTTTCSRCGAEVRWGWRATKRLPVRPRPDFGFWMHREPLDHEVVLGTMRTPEMIAADEAAAQLPRDRDGEVYTTYGYDVAKMKKAEREARAADEEDDAEAPEPIPDPEVRAEPITVGDERLPGGAKQVITLAHKHAWETDATYSRGPRTHATHGRLLSISDFVVVRLRLDGTDRRAVASWCDMSFDFAYNIVRDAEHEQYITDRTNFAGLKAWIKNEEEV